MRHLLSIVLACATSAALAQIFDTPFIQEGPSNDASLMPQEWPGGGIAQGCLFVVKGYGLVGNLMVPSATHNSFPLTPEFNGTSITVTVGDTTVNAFVIAVGYDQTPLGFGLHVVTGLLPSGTPLGEGTLVVSYNGKTTRPRPIRVVRHAFGIYTQNQLGTGAGMFRNIRSETDQPYNRVDQGAAPGQAVILTGTGLGAVSGREESLLLPGEMDVPVDVFVGNKPAKVLTKGRSATRAGVDEIVFEAPPGVSGCRVSVAVLSKRDPTITEP